MGKEANFDQLDLFKPQIKSAPKEKITKNEWEEANELAFQMTVGEGKMLKNPSRKEREAQNAKIKKDINRLYAKLGIPPKEGDQAEMPFKDDKK